MLRTIAAIVRDGKIELLERVPLTEGSTVLVTLLPGEQEQHFWLQASEHALATVWENAEDDVYAKLLKK